ncbi:hypothetical protein [Achromobacter sp. EB05]|uniref:hypothetical protein n=1 Tax=Achromobacter sp. EB05 TaxID=3142974 RepID=UPI00378392B4
MRIEKSLLTGGHPSLSVNLDKAGSTKRARRSGLDNHVIDIAAVAGRGGKYPGKKQKAAKVSDYRGFSGGA